MYQEMTRQLISLDDGPAWQGTIRYNNACSFSLLGEKETAINELREALKLNPGLTEWSRQDSDFEPIRVKPDIRHFTNKSYLLYHALERLACRMCKPARSARCCFPPQTARLWLTDLDEIIRAVCALLTRNLTLPVLTLHTQLNLKYNFAPSLRIPD
jgi:hypothetical protein